MRVWWCAREGGPPLLLAQETHTCHLRLVLVWLLLLQRLWVPRAGGAMHAGGEASALLLRRALPRKGALRGPETGLLQLGGPRGPPLWRGRALHAVRRNFRSPVHQQLRKSDSSGVVARMSPPRVLLHRKLKCKMRCPLSVSARAPTA